jgi:TonB family protein
MKDISRSEEQNRQKGIIFSVVVHTLLIILTALYGFTYQNPPPEQEGILVNLGIPDVGQGEENAPAAPSEAPAEKPQPTPVEPTPPPKPAVTERPKPQPQKEIRQTEDPEAVAIRKQKEEEKKRKEAEDRQRQIEEKQKRDAEAKAETERKRIEAEQKALRDKIAGGGIGGGSGSGKGNTGKPGNQGDPNGDPNSKVLTGISTGSGVVGGGLGNRGVTKKGPSINDNTQEEGTVVLAVCVDEQGSVISAEYTQSGSTTNNEKLKRLAIQNARQWKFNKGAVEKQCGTIRYDFRLR